MGRKMVNNKKQRNDIYLVVANTLPPTFSLTQSLRDTPLGDRAEEVLRREKLGALHSLVGKEEDGGR